MNTKTIKGLVIGLAAGALVFGGFAAAQAAPAAVGAAIGVAAKTSPPVQRYLMGPLGVLAKLTGLKAEDIITQRKAGKSLADIAKSKGVTVDKLIDEVIAARKAALDVRVKQGVITQAQEDAALEFMRTRMKERFESNAAGGPCQGGGRGQRGRGMGGSGGGGFGAGPGAGAGVGAGAAGGPGSVQL